MKHIKKLYAIVTVLALAVTMLAGTATQKVAAEDAESLLQPWTFVQTGTSTCAWNKWEKCYFTGATTDTENFVESDFKSGVIYGDGNSSDQGDKATFYETASKDVSPNFTTVIGSNGWSGEWQNGVLVDNNPYTLAAKMNKVNIKTGHFYTITYTVGWNGEADVAKNNPNGATKTKGIRTTISDSYTNGLDLLEGSDPMDVFVKSGETRDLTYKFICYAPGATVDISLQMGAFLYGDGTGNLDYIETGAHGTVTVTNFKITDDGADPNYEEVPSAVTDTDKTNQTVNNKPTVQTNTNTVKTLAKVTKVKAKYIKKKTIKVTWKKVAKAKKYQIKIGKKTYTSTKTSKTVKKLKKGTYKVKVRALKNGTYATGPWSKTVKVKVKK